MFFRMTAIKLAENCFPSSPFYHIEKYVWNTECCSEQPLSAPISVAPKHQQLPPLSGNALTQHSTQRLASCMRAHSDCQTLCAPPQFTFVLPAELPAWALLLWLSRDFNSLSCAVFWLDTFSGTEPKAHMIGQGLSEACTWLGYPTLTYRVQSPAL